MASGQQKNTILLLLLLVSCTWDRNRELVNQNTHVQNAINRIVNRCENTNKIGLIATYSNIVRYSNIWKQIHKIIASMIIIKMIATYSMKANT
jgi:uncharacterized protein involved in propanediol utilization